MAEEWKCTKCGRMTSDPKKHYCYPELRGLGTQQMGRLRGSSVGRQIDGNVELAYHRAKASARKEAAKIIAVLLVEGCRTPERIKKKAAAFVKNYL